MFDVLGSYGNANTKEVWRRYMKGQHESYSETIGDNYQVRCGGIGRRLGRKKVHALVMGMTCLISYVRNANEVAYPSISYFHVGCKSSPSHILNKKESNSYENDEMGLH